MSYFALGEANKMRYNASWNYLLEGKFKIEPTWLTALSGIPQAIWDETHAKLGSAGIPGEGVGIAGSVYFTVHFAINVQDQRWDRPEDRRVPRRAA